jgi:DNA-binding transcriptional MerR regulator
MRLIDFVLRLRGTGMSMRDIQEYVRLRRLGETPESIRLRGDLLARHAAYLRGQLTELTETIVRLDEKIALYRSIYPDEPLPAEPPVTKAAPANAPSKRRRHA